MFAAAKLQCNFEAVAVDVVEILHSTRDVVPEKALFDDIFQTIQFEFQISEELRDLIKNGSWNSYIALRLANFES